MTNLYAYLVVMRRDGKTDGSRFPIYSRLVTIGSDRDCTIRLSRPKVAPKQCLLSFDDEGKVSNP